jgi:hypothetical protein
MAQIYAQRARANNEECTLTGLDGGRSGEDIFLQVRKKKYYYVLVSIYLLPS